MRSAYLEAFIESTAIELEGLLKTEVHRGRVYFRSTAIPPSQMSAALSAAEDLADEVVIDVDEDTARRIAEAYAEAGDTGWEDSATMEGMIAALPDRIVARTKASLAGSAIRQGSRPIRAAIHPRLEIGLHRGALEIPLETKSGKVVIDVTLRSRPR